MKLRSTSALRDAMKEAGLTVRAVAEASDCSKTFVGALLTGDRDGCSTPLAALIAAAVGQTVDSLFEVRVSARVRPRTAPAAKAQLEHAA